MQYYSAGDYSSALEQNLVTRDLIGRDTPEILKNSAVCHSMLLKPRRAVYCQEKYMKLRDVHTADDYTQLASYYGQSGDLDRAEQVLLDSTETSFQLQHDLVMHYFRRGEYEKALKSFELAKKTYNVLWIGERKWRDLPNCPRWSGESVRGKTVCLVGECGLGDEIAFSRWIPLLLREARDVYYLTDNSLVDVFTRNFPDLKKWEPDVSYDVWLPTMSLPLATKKYEPDCKPYLTASEEHVEKWRSRLPVRSGFYCFNWTGSKSYSQNHFRDIPIDYLMSKFRNKSCVNACMETDYNPPGMLDLRGEITCWEDTLAILHLSEMVYSSCSSVAHAAGALGKRAFVYTRPDDYFTWNSTESGKQSRWHESVTVWRTKSIGKWKDIIDDSLK